MQLGLAPRLDVEHTSAREMGQIYVPQVNWALMVATLVIVIGFGSSSAIAAAYGIAVTLTMVITVLLLYVVMTERWRWPKPAALALMAEDVVRNVHRARVVHVDDAHAAHVAVLEEPGIRGRRLGRGRADRGGQHQAGHLQQLSHHVTRVSGGGLRLPARRRTSAASQRQRRR